MQYQNDLYYESTLAQSRAFTSGSSSSLTTGAGLAILDITKTSRSKLATSFGKMKNDMNQLVLDANLAKANAELDYSDRVGEKKLELAEYLATKLGTLYTAISDMKVNFLNVFDNNR